LTENDSGRFEDRWVYLHKAEKAVDCVWLRGLPEVFNLPVAHAEGKFYAETAILDKIEANGQAVLRYKDSQYPFNPNGSLNNIAGITDRRGKVLGLMPHPERFMFKHHFPYWQSRDVYPWGLKFFQNAVNYVDCRGGRSATPTI
jgi:phosphoribosylformylglycinamidine synthase